MKYVNDDSTVFWAFGSDNGVIAKHAEFCGQEIEMAVPFEGVSSGEVKDRDRRRTNTVTSFLRYYT